MYLKALEIQGFKSFADKTRLTFEKDITAIVGPNGSGKSNISDAVLWVMGEQRSKALRGSKMEDVIFGGTEKRSKLGFAQVTLIIDNSNHIFQYDSSEIMLTRRYYRSGESEYYINKEAVRLKDIHSLLMDTGLGRDGYSIIGQGRIAEIVSSRSTDRREVFEEAAGISRFRYRKEEAERKLEKTEDNLLRINDKIEELEMQVGPLKKQAETAKRYLVLRDELRVREISVWMETLDKLHAQAQAVELEYGQTLRELEGAKAELEALYASTGNISERMHRKDVESEKARECLSAEEGALSECEAAIAVLEANLENSRRSMERMLGDISRQESRSGELRSRIDEGRAQLEKVDAELSELQTRLVSNGNVLEGCRMKLKNREDSVNIASQQLNAITVDARSMDGRIKMLEDMQRDYEGYSKAVKTVMRETGRGVLRGVYAPVVNLIKTEGEFALAIETALGANAQNIVVENAAVGKQGIELLKRQDAGRATFVPLDITKGSILKNCPVNDPGYMGLASELVSCEDKFSQVIASYLGRTVVAETLSDAMRMARQSGHSLRIVTLDGQLVNPGGSMAGGSAARGTGTLSRGNELEKLKKQRLSLDGQEKECAQRFERAKSALASVRYQLDMALEDQSGLRAQQSSLEAEKRTMQSSLEQLEMLLVSLSGDSEARRQAVEAAEGQMESIRRSLREREAKQAEIKGRIKAVRDEINSISSSKLELEAKRTRAEREAQQKNAHILELERRSARIEQKKLTADMEEKQLLDKLWENYELSHSAAMEIRRPVESLSRENREIAELRRQISALGNPNIGAIEEFERVNSRYEFLSSQRDDVNKAKAELEGIINDITGQMKEVFLERFREIDESFRRTFLELFGGGKASLVLEDESNVLECGIDIRVQPPGKKLSTISLLSGGEMAFVAIALYFAILKVRPTPFCVMDEIEAALDEENVSRYAAYMRRMADKTQFLVITHRRGTMEEADMLYGVTMQEKGVSTVIELDLATAEKTIEE